jgi:hypothetical protein
MSFDDRVRSTVDQALGSLVQQLIAQALEEREAAVRDARAAAYAESEQKTLARVADAETRIKASMEDAIKNARIDERAAATRDVRSKVEGELEPKISEAVANAEAKARAVLADAQAKAAVEIKAAVAQARVREREIEMAGVTRLLESVRGLDGATSLSEVLDALALAAHREAARAAVVVLRGERINGWRLYGFGPRDAQPKQIDLALADCGVIGLAISTGRAVTTRDSQGAAVGPGFEKIPPDRMGLAAPVVVGGRVVAVVYADAVALDGHARPVPSSWPELIEVLARHAGRCLEALTVSKTQPPKVTSSGTPGASASSSTPPVEAPPTSGPATL